MNRRKRAWLDRRALRKCAACRNDLAPSNHGTHCRKCQLDVFFQRPEKKYEK